MPVAYIVCPKNCTHCSKVMAQKLREWTYGQAAVHRVFTPMLRPKYPGGGDDRVSGTDAERDDDIYHNGTSGFGGNAARGEMADLSRVLINAQISAPAIITPTLHVQKTLYKQFDEGTLWVACNVLHTMEARLCRWLLQATDCMDGNDIPLTQEFLGQMLGVRRTTVTLAA
jgi:Crp-like helix-turn-helix domain